MNQFAELLREVADEKNHTLSNCLFKAKLLAANLKGRKFKQWINAELEGYQQKGDVPDYGIIRPPLVGDFHGPGGSAVNRATLSTSGLPENIRELVDKLRL